MTTDTMPADVIEYLAELVQEDRDQQIAAIEAALAVATRAAAFFPPTGD